MKHSSETLRALLAFGSSQNYAPAGTNPVLCSAIYNGSYLVIELIISAIIMYIIVKRRLFEIYL